MGYFDAFKKRNKPSASSPTPSPAPASEATPGPAPVSETSDPGAEVKTAGFVQVGPRLAQARTFLEGKDLKSALAIYEELLAEAGERADVLVAISGDLGSHGHLVEIVEHIAPRYDAQRHGPATGINVLQAYLGLRDPDAARHVLDILFALNRLELEERLHGFSNAIAELIHDKAMGSESAVVPMATGMAPAQTKISMITISKPIWFYGLESIAAEVLPAKTGRLRGIAFAQLALPGLEDWRETARQPEHELTRLSRSIPLWLAEHLAFSPAYSSLAVTGMMDEPETGRRYALFPEEWSTEQLQQLVSTNAEPLDYVVTGALQKENDEVELLLRLWEVKKFRERKQFHVRWTPATADAELGSLLRAISLFMEFQPYPAGQGVAYSPTQHPRGWLDTLAASLSLFLAEKNVLPLDRVNVGGDLFENAAARAGGSTTEALAWLTLSRRAARLGLAVDAVAKTLPKETVVERARDLKS